jgi:hypothetical protein
MRKISKNNTKQYKTIDWMYKVAKSCTSTSHLITLDRLIANVCRLYPSDKLIREIKWEWKAIANKAVIDYHNDKLNIHETKLQK